MPSINHANFTTDTDTHLCAMQILQDNNIPFQNLEFSKHQSLFWKPSLHHWLQSSASCFEWLAVFQWLQTPPAVRHNLYTHALNSLRQRFSTNKLTSATQSFSTNALNSARHQFSTNKYKYVMHNLNFHALNSTTNIFSTSTGTTFVHLN